MRNRKRHWILKRTVLGLAVTALVAPAAAQARVDEGTNGLANSPKIASRSDRRPSSIGATCPLMPEPVLQNGSPMFTHEERTAFIQLHPELAYASDATVEREMQIEDECISLDLDGRVLAWIPILLDPGAPNEVKATAWRMIYLTGFLDCKAGRAL
jgi:hypothetical protein